MSANIGELYEGSCLIVNYVLSTGQKGSLPLNKEQCKYYLDCIDKSKTMVLQVGDEIRTLNPHHVAFTYIKGLQENEISIKVMEPVETNLETASSKLEIQKIGFQEELKKAYYVKDLFQIECKCGEEYQKEYPSYSQKNSCGNCGAMVFVDRRRGKQLSENGQVWIMTNRYFVDRDFSQKI